MKTYSGMLRVYRGLNYLLHYLIFELPRGLDISLRNKASNITLPGNHGYALTSKSALKNMLGDINLNNLSLIDIGSGKGGVIIYARQLGCKYTAGIEYEKFLHDIAVNNIRILKLDKYCRSYNIDARLFESYENYDIYFMFNPFDDDIYESVIKKLTSQVSNAREFKQRFLICYGSANIEAVVNSKLFTLVREAKCPYRGNMFRVFKSNILHHES